MKKNYYVPATEVVAFVGGAVMQAQVASPGQDPLNPNGANSATNGDPIP